MKNGYYFWVSFGICAAISGIAYEGTLREYLYALIAFISFVMTRIEFILVNSNKGK